MNIEPLFDRVVLRAVGQETVTNSGIILPDSTTKERPYVYEVVAVGPGKKDADMSGIQIGDKVLCGQYAGDEVKVEDENYKLVALEYILAKIN
ncbi:co-chaperone GroES [Candidatus Gracilibacteria bacterium]|nr:co-chaperone GroES [Candidatus Gracilibacteria bacterium]